MIAALGGTREAKLGLGDTVPGTGAVTGYTVLDLFRMPTEEGAYASRDAAGTVLGGVLKGAKAIADVSASYAAHAFDEGAPGRHVIV